MLPSASIDDLFDFFDSSPNAAHTLPPKKSYVTNNDYDWTTFDNDSTLKWFDNEHYGIIPDPKQELINYKAELLHGDEIEILMTHFVTNLCSVNKEIVPVEIELLILKFMGNLFFESTILDEENKRILLSLLIKYKKWNLNKMQFDLFKSFGDHWVKHKDDNNELQKEGFMAAGSLLIVKSNYGRIFGAIVGEMCDPFLFVLSDDNANDIEPRIFDMFAPQFSTSDKYNIQKWERHSGIGDIKGYTLGESDLVIYTAGMNSSCMSSTFEAVGNQLCGGDVFVNKTRLGVIVPKYFFQVELLEEHNITWDLS